MPRVRRKTKSRASNQLTFYQAMALNIGWRDPLKHPFVPREQLGWMKFADVESAWRQHADNPRLCKWVDPEAEDYRPGRRPWAWWRFDSPEPRDRTKKQHEQLRELGLLLEHEEIDLKRAELRKVREIFTPPPEPDGGFFPIPEPEPYPENVQELIDRATKQVENEDWFSWIRDERTGKLSPADADAVINHGCTVDLERGWHAVDFIETYCKQSQGEWEGEYFELFDWQVRDFLLPVFSWVRPDGTRRFREADLWISKKQGKSSLCGALQAYGSIADGEGGPKIFTAAVTRQQCEEVYGTTTALIAASPELSVVLVPKESKKEVHIRSKKTGGLEQFVIKALAAEAGSAEGKNAHMLFRDEMHVWDNWKFYGALRFAGDARRQWLSFRISTAGADVEGTIGGDEYSKDKRIVEGKEFCYFRFAKIFEAPDGLDYNDPRVYMNPAIWKMAAPSLGLTTKYTDFYSAILDSVGDAKKWVDLLRYKFNRWMEGGQPYIPMVAWRQCSEEKFDESFLAKRDCYSGLDLSSHQDTTCLCHCFPIEIEKIVHYYFLWRTWVPEERILENLKDKNARYKNAMNRGELQSMPGARIEHEIIFRQFMMDYRTFKLLGLAFDNWGTGWIENQIDARGIDIVDFPQNNAKYFTEPMKQFNAMLKAGRIRTGGNQLAAWQAKNVIAKESDMEYIRPVKKFKDKVYKIDMMVAAYMAFSLALRHGDRRPSVYSNKKAAM